MLPANTAAKAAIATFIILIFGLILPAAVERGPRVSFPSHDGPVVQTRTSMEPEPRLSG